MILLLKCLFIIFFKFICMCVHVCVIMKVLDGNMHARQGHGRISNPAPTVDRPFNK